MKRKSHWIALTALCAGVAVFGLGCEQEIAKTRDLGACYDGTEATDRLEFYMQRARIERAAQDGRWVHQI